jgi:hypothetical protein
MATTATITPTLGSAPVTLQAGNYSAIDDRRFWGAGLTTEGAISNGSYKVIQRAAGANMTVDVQSSTGDGAAVQGDNVTAQGKYFVPPTAANVNVDIAAADATNPRNDLVVLEVKDDQHDASGLNLARVRVITGTPNASAALTDAPGANGTPALPSSCLLLAVVRVAAGATSIATAAISDRRTLLPTAGWMSYTPTLKAVTTDPTLGTGSSALGYYQQVGKIVEYRFFITFGSSGVVAGSGQYYVTLPVTAATMDPQIPLGNARFFDSSTNVVLDPRVRWYSTTGCDFAWSATWPSGSASAATNSLPWTWAASDFIAGQLTYEAA